MPLRDFALSIVISATTAGTITTAGPGACTGIYVDSMDDEIGEAGG